MRVHSGAGEIPGVVGVVVVVVGVLMWAHTAAGWGHRPLVQQSGRKHPCGSGL